MRTGDSIRLLLHEKDWLQVLLDDSDEGIRFLLADAALAEAPLEGVWRILPKDGVLGRNLYYGTASSFRIEHQLSGRCLTLLDTIERSSGYQKLGLLPATSVDDSCNWHFRPVSTVRKDGDLVHDEDNVLLVHAITRLSLAVQQGFLATSAHDHTSFRLRRWAAYVPGSSVRYFDACAVVHRETGCYLQYSEQGDSDEATTVSVPPGQPVPISAWWYMVPPEMSTTAADRIHWYEKSVARSSLIMAGIRGLCCSMRSVASFWNVQLENLS